MPFLEIASGLSIGSIDNEKALRLRCRPDPSLVLTFVETEEGSELRIEDARRDLLALELDATQLRALGLFCVRQFMAAEPGELLARIQCSADMAIAELEAWNERARSDEEHPPYDRIVARLREIEGAREELLKALRRLENA